MRKSIFIILFDQRAWGMSRKECREAAAQALREAANLKRDATPLASFLFGNTAKVVTSELERRKSALATSQTMPTIWRDTHKTFLASKGLKLHMLPPPTSKWISAMSPPEFAERNIG